MKRWAVGALSLGMFALFVCASAAGAQQRGTIAGASMIATALLAVALLFTFVDEPVRPTRRMQHHPRSLLVRAFYPRCLAPSVFFTLVASAIALVSIPVLAGAPASLERDALWAVACVSALGGFMGWVAARRGAARARKLGAFALVGLPLLVAFLRDDSRGPSWVDGICPLWLDARSRGRRARRDGRQRRRVGCGGVRVPRGHAPGSSGAPRAARSDRRSPPDLVVGRCGDRPTEPLSSWPVRPTSVPFQGRRRARELPRRARARTRRQRRTTRQTA